MSIALRILQAIGLYWLKKHGIETAFAAIVSASETAAQSTETQLDDNAVAKFKADKSEILALVNGLL